MGSYKHMTPDVPPRAFSPGQILIKISLRTAHATGHQGLLSGPPLLGRSGSRSIYPYLCPAHATGHQDQLFASPQAPYPPPPGLIQIQNLKIGN